MEFPVPDASVAGTNPGLMYGDLTQWAGNFPVSVKSPNLLRDIPIPPP
jgi:hypothetical protein